MDSSKRLPASSVQQAEPQAGILAPPATLTTERLIIRPLEIGDLDPVVGLYRDIGWDVAGLSESERRARRQSWLEWTIAGYREFPRLSQPTYGERAVVKREDGAFIGLVGLVPSLGPFAQLPGLGSVEHARFSPEAGLFWAIAPAHQRQGYAAEAARAFVDHIASLLTLQRLVATTEHDNAASIRVMRKIGMRIETNPSAEPPWFQVVGVIEPGSAGGGAPYRPARDRERDISAQR